MKLVTFKRAPEAGDEIGAMQGDGTVAVLAPASDPAFASMLALIEGGEAAIAAANQAISSAERLPYGKIIICAPLPRPTQMRDTIGFEKHIRQARANTHIFGRIPARLDPRDVEVAPVWFEQPIFYKCNRLSISGPEAEVRWPAGETHLDFELEMAVIIGKQGRDISASDAPGHIFGFTIFNDFSARDKQFRETVGGLGPAKGKDFDTGNALGPCIVTIDEIGNYNDLRMQARLNGETLADGRSSEMHHSFERIIEHISTDETLYPGEVIGSGTLGDGCGLEHGRFLEPGDQVELEIENIGILRNTIGPRR